MRPLRTTSYTEQARDAIRDLILNGTYKPGDRLKEVELSNGLGISRSPVREAIASLANEGLISFVPHRGAFVRSFDLAEVRHLYEVREGLEIQAVRLATQRARDDEIGELAKLLDETLYAPKEHLTISNRRDLDFHTRLSRMSANRRLTEYVTAVNTQLQLARLKSLTTPGRARQAYDEHVAVLEAIKQREVSGAEQAMRFHLRNALRSLEGVAVSTAEEDNGYTLTR